jgi:hypothetical protein
MMKQNFTYSYIGAVRDAAEMTAAAGRELRGSLAMHVLTAKMAAKRLTAAA